ncbi:MAG: class I SAM-dependent methyltransferase [Lachnospiraceae bacterium]|nr:class I SAM-dependent methyltransferase [Lachnospiraceae bacterium]
MKDIHRKCSHDYWDGIHVNYERAAILTDDWLESFADIIDSCSGPIADLGCGSGNDTLWLLSKGKEVIACDQSENAIRNIRKNFPEIREAKCFNMLDGLPFADASFELVIADLCLHYFRDDDTRRIIKEIGRILQPGGHLILRVNSVNDVNHGAGQGIELEHHVYELEDRTIKRFFDEEDVRRFFGDFEIVFLKEEIMTRYKLEKQLFRVCVRKKEGYRCAIANTGAI